MSSEGKDRSPGFVAAGVVLVLVLVSILIYGFSPVAFRNIAASTQISLEVNLGEIIGGLLIGSASLLASVAYALRIRRNDSGGTSGSPPRDPRGSGGPGGYVEQESEQVMRATQDEAENIRAQANAYATKVTQEADAYATKVTQEAAAAAEQSIKNAETHAAQIRLRAMRPPRPPGPAT